MLRLNWRKLLFEEARLIGDAFILRGSARLVKTWLTPVAHTRGQQDDIRPSLKVTRPQLVQIAITPIIEKTVLGEVGEGRGTAVIRT